MCICCCLFFFLLLFCYFFFFFQAEDGIRDLVRSRGLGDVYKRQTQISEDFIITNSITEIEENSILSEYTLEQIGFPPFAIINIETDDDIHYIELTKDLSKYPLLNN